MASLDGLQVGVVDLQQREQRLPGQSMAKYRSWKPRSCRSCIAVRSLPVVFICGIALPKTVNVHASVRIKEAIKFSIPIALSACCEPVWERRHARPDDTFVHGSICNYQEGVVFDTVIEGRIVLVGHSRIHHYDIVLLMAVQVVYKLLHQVQWEAYRIQSEDFAEIHVVDVGPHCLKGDIRLTVICHYTSYLVHILHAISALVEAKRPVCLQSRVPDSVSILHCDLLWSRASQEVKIHNASESVVLKILPCLGCVVDLNIHAVGVGKEDCMSARTSTMVEVYWVVTVEVGTCRYVSIEGLYCP